MKSYLRFSVAALILLVMASLPWLACGAREQPPTTTIMWEPVNIESWSSGGRDRVQTIIGEMNSRISGIPSTGPLTDNIIGSIVEIYGYNGILTGHEGKTYRGDREIYAYFRQLMSGHTVTDLKIEIKFVYAKEFTDRAMNTNGPDSDFVHSLYFILSCSYKLDGRLVDPPSFTSCPHSRMCDCSTRE